MTDLSPKQKVLVADDAEDLRLLYSFILRKEGWDPIEARNGQEALDHVLHEDFGLVLLDQCMPGMTGLEVYHSMRQQERTPPVILMSAASEVEHLAKQHGVQHFLGKPILVQELIRTVRLVQTDAEQPGKDR